MPESEPKPKALESVPAGSAQGWKATLRNGRQAVVHEIPVPPAAAAAAVPRIQRLAEHPHPCLSPILAWGTDANGLWIAVEQNEGTPLSAVLARGRFTAHAASALGTSILSGIAALHEAGVAMGGFDATAVRITQNGEVRLAGHPVAAVRGAPSQSDLRADVRSCGMAICAAFGVDPAGAPAPPELPPGLVVTMRSMASGAMGPAVDRAQGALREMAGPLMAPDRQIAAQSELALRAGGREMPSVTPLVPEAPKPAAPPVEDMPPPRPASYEPPPRAVSTYSSLPRPQENYAPPSAYQSAPPAPTAPVAPPEPPPAPEPPAPVPTPVPTPAFASQPPTPAAPSPPADAAPWEPEHPTEAPAAPGPEPVAEPAPEPVVAEAAAAAAAAAPEVMDWPEPGRPETAPAASASPPAPSAPREQTGAPTWTPVQTGSWTPGASHVSSSEWTGEATPVPAPVPEELKAAITSPSYVAPATFAPAAPATSEAPSAPATWEPAQSVTTPPIPRAAAPKPAAKPKRAERDDRGGGGGVPRERPGWLVPAAIVVVVLLVLGGGAVYFAGKLGNSTSAVANSSPSPSTSHKPSPSPSTGIQQVPVYAPGAAAPITSVTIDPAASNCTQIGGSCKLEVDIKFSAVQRGNVSFIIKYFDRCAGTSQDLPGTQFTPPGFNLVILDKTVTLPAGAKAAAVVVVTQSPSVAASAPLLLGADSC